MRIDSILSRVFRRGDPVEISAAHANALAEELAERLPAAAVEPRRRWLWLAAGSVLALAGACVAPARYEVTVAYVFRVRIPIRGAEPEVDPRALASHVTEVLAPETLQVMVRQVVHEREGVTRDELDVQLVVAGDFAPAEVEEALRERFAAIAEADIQVEILDGDVEGTFGGLVGRRALGWDIDHESVEETRARILAELQARGIRGEPKIEISEHHGPDGHRKEVRVEVESEGE